MILTIRSTAGWLATAILLFRPAKGVDNPVDPTMSTDLKMALTHLNYMNSLSDEDLVYDFNKVMANPWKPGSVLNANAATWPLLMNTRQTVAQLNLGPCAMLAPHLHPRGTNLVVAVTGTTRTFMQSENGAIVRQTTLTPGKMTIFPQASVHSMYNEGCGNNLLYSFLDSSDPGTLNIGQTFMAMSQDIATTVMPFIRLVDGDWNKTKAEIPAIGTGSQEGFDACKKRCGLSS